MEEFFRFVVFRESQNSLLFFMKHSMIQDYLSKTNQNASIFGNRLTSNHPSFYVIGMKLMKIMLHKRLYLESSMKIKSFFNQWMAALGSDATKQDNCKGSPSVRATSFGFSRKNGTTPSMTSVVTVCCKMWDFLYQPLTLISTIWIWGKEYRKLAKIEPHLYLNFDGFLTFSRCKMRNFVHWHVFTSMHSPSKIFLAISFFLHYISKTTTFFDNGNLGIKANISIRGGRGSIIHELDNGLWDSKALNGTVVPFLF